MLDENELRMAVAQISALESQAADLKEQADKTLEQRDAFLEEAKTIKADLLKKIQATNEKKVEFDLIKFTRVSGRKSVQIIDESKIDKKFKKKKETFSVEKAAIKKAIEAGEKVEGAKLVTGDETLKIEEIDPEI